MKKCPNWNGNVSGKGSPNILRRLIAYSEKVFRFSTGLIASLTDRRPEPRISTATVARAAMVLFWARMGSLNALEMSGASRFWKHWLGHPMPSAETMGDVHSKMDADTLRKAIHQVYGCLKSNKALPDNGGISLAIVDGHESHASYRRHCPGCLARTIHSQQGDRIQYYHRQVTLLLVTGAPPGRQPLRIPLDHEPQLPGEEEVATAMRLLKRVLLLYPRAFDLVLADALSYARDKYPDAKSVIDLATLTGACVIALGSVASGLLATDDKLAAEIEKASFKTGERVWRLPMFPEFEQMIAGKQADIKNTAEPGGEGSTITPAFFLKNFIGKWPWAHLDIAGTAYQTTLAVRNYYAWGPTGVGVRLCTQYLLDHSGK